MTAGDRDATSVATVVAALALVTLAAVAPTLVGARPANEIPLTDLSGETDSLTDPTGDAWNETPSKEVALASAPSGAPNANDTSVESLSVSAATTDQRLFLRLDWADPAGQENLTGDQYETPRVNAFADAAAVQLPANVSAEPGIAMGSDRTPVNVWYWNAGTGGQELMAGGPGTTTPVSQTVATNATYEDGRWHVVYARNLSADAGNRTTFESEENVQVAFAVWNGTNAERAGHKSVSDWQYFPTGPGPQGPPYETIMWIVAGLAVVVVVAATVIGVRRA